MLQTPGVLERPDWWTEFVNKPDVGGLRSKLWSIMQIPYLGKIGHAG